VRALLVPEPRPTAAHSTAPCDAADLPASSRPCWAKPRAFPVRPPAAALQEGFALPEQPRGAPLVARTAELVPAQPGWHPRSASASCQLQLLRGPSPCSQPSVASSDVVIRCYLL
jgi:hypothetical protein